MAIDDQNGRRAAEDLDKTEVVAAPEISAGMLLNDRYRLVRRINQGGFGAVYLARDAQMHDRQVVVKIPIDQRVDDPWFERKFGEEVRALSMIDHPGVVVAIDSGRTPEGLPFLVMQYVEGATLRAVMSPEGMPLDRAADIIKQIGHALGAAHDRGIWHRDLKPENLMLQTTTGPGERVRLIDFGIATVADLKNKFQTATRVAGTVMYMAPEQAEGQPSAQTDIYAMGLIAYEMVTGRRPFMADNAFQLVRLQRAGVRVKPSDLRPGLPAAAERLILRSLEFEPTRRPVNARVFGDELHAALLSASAPGVHGQTIVRKAPTRRSSRIFGLAACAAIVLIGAALYEFGSHENLTRNAPTKIGPTKIAPTATSPAKSEPSSVPAPPVPVASVPDNDALGASPTELAYWNAVKDSSEPKLFKAYLKEYPHGRFASLARTKLDLLKGKSRASDIADGQNVVFPNVPGFGNFSVGFPNISPELKDWEKLRKAKGPEPYRKFLAKYPNGMFATVARIKIASFEKGGVPDSSDTPDKPERPEKPEE